MGDASSLGFAHFIEQSDIVAKILLAVLTIMSVISWYLLVYKGISQVVRRRRSATFLAYFWSAKSLEEVQEELSAFSKELHLEFQAASVDAGLVPELQRAGRIGHLHHPAIDLVEVGGRRDPQVRPEEFLPDRFVGAHRFRAEVPVGRLGTRAGVGVFPFVDVRCPEGGPVEQFDHVRGRRPPDHACTRAPAAVCRDGPVMA